ncbi:MAG: LCP family protein [Brotaphodocola sp.]
MNRERELWEKRKRAREAEKEKALDIMGDATVRPLKRETPETSVKEEMAASIKPETVKHSRSAGARGTGLDGKGGSEVRRRLEEEAVKRKKRRRMILMVIAECIALVFIFGYAYVARQLNKIQRPEDFKISELETNELNVDTVETMKGYWTIAIFGVDARNNAINKGTNADVNMICNINRDTGEIKLVSVFRDTYLNISEGGSYNKLNQAYFVGGPEQAVQALNRNLDLQINDYMTFNWKAVADAINVLGGVDIELSNAEFYYINSFITETVKATGVGSKQLTHAGMNHLDGVQAVAYGRLRLMDTDYARTERQRKVIAKAFEKAKTADFKTLNTLIGTVFPQVSTSIWVDDLVANAKNISKFHLGETTGFPQARGDANMGKKGAVVVPQTLESNVIKLHEFLYGDAEYTPSQTVKNISAKIASDTGMYREGQYVDHVSTEGVIQKPKATAAATTAADETKESVEKTSAAETDESGESTEQETDEDGNPVTRPTAATKPGTKPTAAETDENGELIEQETDEDGNPAETKKNETKESETDEDGNPAKRETLTSEKPTSASETSSTKSESSSSETETTSGTGVTTRPGSTTETTAGHMTSQVPGSSNSPSTGTSSGNGVVSAPGASTGTTTGNTTVKAPGSSSSSSEITSPGTGTSTVPTAAVPIPTTAASATGTVAAPGH